MRHPILILWLMLAVPSMATAAPSERPPQGYDAAQYIDRKGCVFLRQNGDWTARRDRDGQPVCGFPPSLPGETDGGTASGSDLHLSPAEIERQLITTVVTSGSAMRSEATGDADMAATPTGPEGRKPPPISRADIGGDLAEEIAIAMQMRSALGAARPYLAAREERLCALMGMRPVVAGQARDGHDPTGGFCTGASRVPSARRVATRDAGRGSEGKRRNALTAGRSVEDIPAAGPASPSEPAAASSRHPAVARKTGPVQTEIASERLHARRSERAKVHPSHARDAIAAPPAPARQTPPETETPRYVQLGRYGPDGVDKAIADLRAMGYRPLRERDPGPGQDRRVMTGPFSTSGDLEAALQRLKRAGYFAAIAR